MKQDQIRAAIERKLTEKYGGVSRKTVKKFLEDHPGVCTYSSIYFYLLGHRTLTYYTKPDGKNNLLDVLEALKLEVK
jgi:hypothetical protein